MKAITVHEHLLAYVLCFFVVFLYASQVLAEDLKGPSAEEIVRKSSEVDKLPNWKSKNTMRLISKGSSERIRESVNYNKLDKNGHDTMRLIRFVAPADIKGTNILIHEHRDSSDDIWTYLPSIKKVRRLVAGNKKDSFIGTDFSYTDIVTPKVQDYSHTLLRKEPLNGIQCFVIESVPRTEEIKKNTGYSKTITWIRTDNFVRIKSELYDPSGALYKIMLVRSIKEVDRQRGKWLVEKVEMQNTETGHSTVITFSDIKVGEVLDNRLFLPNRLDLE